MAGLPAAQDFYFTSANCTGQRYFLYEGTTNISIMSSNSTLFDNLGGNPAWWTIGDEVTLPITTRSRSENVSCIASTTTWSNAFDPNDPDSNPQNTFYKYNPTTSPIPAITGPIRLAVR